jgi:hypothetical protein
LAISGSSCTPRHDDGDGENTVSTRRFMKLRGCGEQPAASTAATCWLLL